ncbi:permease prefix domain 1-containing protein [Clostridium neuense]|uniref:Permease prefix domain 1-containing protein n=1 Tax=Clostridium neuense TaxID=1728934 RepID=A0ABW8TAT0_9CLOT
MYEKLRVRVNKLFENAPNTKAAYEIKEEFTANLIDKYDDLIKEGKSEDEAINIAIAGVGDVDSIIKELDEKENNNKDEYDKIENQRKKSAVLVATAVALYIISVAAEMFCNDYLNLSSGIADVVMFVIIAVATFILIYNALSKPKTKYDKVDDSMVEDFKEWRNQNNTQKEVKKSLRVIVWCIVLVVYFAVSFTWYNFEISWIIFIMGVAVDRIVCLVLELRK